MTFEPGKPRPKNAGRKKGTLNKRTQAKGQALAAGMTPLQFFEKMMAGQPIKMADGSMYQPTIDDQRWGADKAAPYRHPRLSAVRVSDAGRKGHEEWLREINEGLDDED